MDKTAYLKNVPLFAEFGRDDLQRLQRIGRIQKFGSGETIFNEDTSGECLYIVIHGRVKIFTCSGHKKKTLAYLEAGEFFGEMSLLDMEPRSASSIAQELCELLVINKKDFRRLLAKHPNISFQTMKTLSHRLRQADKEIESLSFENVLGRIASALLNLAKKYGEDTPQGRRIKMPLNHQEIAELAGTGREMVSRTLNRFRRLQCITFDNRRVVIKNPEKLKEWVY